MPAGAIVLLRRNSRNPWTTYILLAVMTILFVVMSLNDCSIFAVVFLQIRGALTQNLNVDLIPRFQAIDQKAMPLFIIQIWAQPILFILGDAIVVWRVLVLYTERTLASRVIHGVLIVLMIASSGMSLYYGAFNNMDVIGTTGDPAIASKITSVTVFLSFGTNFISTILIGLKTWKHHQAMGAIVGQTANRNEKALQMLIESGAVFCVLQLAYAILSLVDTVNMSPLDWVRSFVTLATQVYASVYPFLVIILISLQMSMTDSASTFSTSGNLESMRVGVSTTRISDQDNSSWKGKWHRHNRSGTTVELDDDYELKQSSREVSRA